MDAGTSKERMAAYLRDQHDKVVGRWSELVVAGTRGRISREEVRHELEDLYSLIVRVLSQADDHAEGELQAALDELSRARAERLHAERYGGWRVLAQGSRLRARGGRRGHGA